VCVVCMFNARVSGIEGLRSISQEAQSLHTSRGGGEETRSTLIDFNTEMTFLGDSKGAEVSDLSFKCRSGQKRTLVLPSNTLYLEIVG